MTVQSESSGSNGGEGMESARAWLTLREAATELRVSQATLRRAYYRQELKVFLIGCSLRIRRQDLEAWIQGQSWSPGLCAQRTGRPRVRRRKPKVNRRPERGMSDSATAAAGEWE